VRCCPRDVHDAGYARPRSGGSAWAAHNVQRVRTQCRAGSLSTPDSRSPLRAWRLRQFAQGDLGAPLHRTVMQALRRLIKGLALGVVAVACLFAVMQLVPYGRAHSNPPVVQEPAWSSPRTRELAIRACFDCHSNETRWPTYADVAPFSWVLQKDVEAGRSVLNFSEWTRPNDLAAEAGASVIRRDMPPRSYRMMHGHAQLTDAETEELARGLDATFGVRRTIASR
jgi:hypothetical protein